MQGNISALASSLALIFFFLVLLAAVIQWRAEQHLPHPHTHILTPMHNCRLDPASLQFLKDWPWVLPPPLSVCRGRCMLLFGCLETLLGSSESLFTRNPLQVMLQYGVILQPGRPEFKCLLDHKPSEVTLDNLLSFPPTCLTMLL